MRKSKNQEYYIKPEQVKFLEDLKKESGPLVLKEGHYIGGSFVKIEEGDIVKLNLDNFTLSSLPESIGNLTSLKQLDLSHNVLTTLPESIGNLTSLTWLNLRDNYLKIIPESFGNLKSLIKLDLGVNFNLRTLPQIFYQFKGFKVPRFNIYSDNLS